MYVKESATLAPSLGARGARSTTLAPLPQN